MAIWGSEWQGPPSLGRIPSPGLRNAPHAVPWSRGPLPGRPPLCAGTPSHGTRLLTLPEACSPVTSEGPDLGAPFFLSQYFLGLPNASTHQALGSRGPKPTAMAHPSEDRVLLRSPLSLRSPKVLLLPRRPRVSAEGSCVPGMAPLQGSQHSDHRDQSATVPLNGAPGAPSPWPTEDTSPALVQTNSFQSYPRINAPKGWVFSAIMS